MRQRPLLCGPGRGKTGLAAEKFGRPNRKHSENQTGGASCLQKGIVSGLRRRAVPSNGIKLRRGEWAEGGGGSRTCHDCLENNSGRIESQMSNY
jgi:hypothetical protein